MVTAAEQREAAQMATSALGWRQNWLVCWLEEKEDKVSAFLALGTDEMREEIWTQWDPGLGRGRQGRDREERCPPKCWEGTGRLRKPEMSQGRLMPTGAMHRPQNSRGLSPGAGTEPEMRPEATQWGVRAFNPLVLKAVESVYSIASQADVLQWNGGNSCGFPSALKTPAPL